MLTSVVRVYTSLDVVGCNHLGWSVLPVTLCHRERHVRPYASGDGRVWLRVDARFFPSRRQQRYQSGVKLNHRRRFSGSHRSEWSG
jgi:hypothetical protein